MRLIITCKNTYKGKGRGFYARVTPVDNGSFQAFVRMLKAGAPFGLNELHKDPHVTVMYSPTPVARFHADQMHETFERRTFLAKVRDLVLWPRHDGGNFVVARLLSSDLDALHQRACALGAVPTFRPYVPHMTLHKKFKATPRIKQWIDDINQCMLHRPPILEFDQFSLEPLRHT